MVLDFYWFPFLTNASSHETQSPVRKVLHNLFVYYFLKFTLNWRITALQVYVGVCCMSGASLIAQLVNHLPAMQETWVQFLGWEDPLEKEMATQSSILAWKIPWTEEPDRLQSMGSQT